MNETQPKGLKDLLVGSWREADDDNIGLIAAGVAFYGFLALVPLLGAMVISYGLIADPQTVIHDMRSVTSVMPADAAKLVGEQLMNVVKTSGSKKGFGLLLALALAIFGARSAALSIITALNVAYEVKERRSFIVINLLALGLIIIGVIVAVMVVVAIAALGHLQKLMPSAPGFLLTLGKLISYLVLGAAGAAGAATLYRYGPSRKHQRWVWLTPGSFLAAVVWLGLTLGFGFYVTYFGHYNATYGSLGAVVILLTWLYFSIYVLLFGAEVNSELDKRTQKSAPLPLDDLKDNAATSPTSSVHRVRLKPATGAISAPHFVAKPASTLASDYAASRRYAKMGTEVGLHGIGITSSGMVTIGLSLIRKPGYAVRGMALLTAAAALSYASRPKRADEVSD